ncbi:MAG TPA: hypothetical protein VEY50_09190 [Lysobacter sp.]|nr:hypothetical protein [Lysobacter sp.]
MRWNHIKEIARSAVLGCALVFVGGIQATQPAAAAASSRQQANTYQVELAIVRDGKVIATPKVTVLFGKPARVTLTEKAGDGSLRVQVTASPAGKLANGTKVVQFNAVVVERIAGAWVILAEPSMKVAESQAGSTTLESPLGSLRIDVRATEKYVAGAESKNLRQCGALTADEPTTLSDNCPSLPCPGKENCCSAPCSDGSGRTMTCCGAIECCDDICGACCSPP